MSAIHMSVKAIHMLVNNPNWDSVGFAISQIGLGQIQKTIPDLHPERRRSVSMIVQDHL